jgi:hypothetical protein
MSGKTRRERVPFGGPRKRLEVVWADKKHSEGYVARWINDQDDRLARAEAAGYEFVRPEEIAGVGDKEVHGGNTDLNSRVSRVVGRTGNDQPIRSYLMKISREFYAEDQQKKEAHNRLTDDSVRAGAAGGAQVDNKYGKVDLRA